MSAKRVLDYNELSEEQKTEAIKFYKANPIIDILFAPGHFLSRSAFVRFYSDGSMEIGYEEPRLNRHHESTLAERPKLFHDGA